MITSTNTKTTDLNLPTLLPKYIRHVRVQKCMNYEEYINDQVPPTLVLLSWIRLSALHSKSFVCTRDLQSWYFSNHIKNKCSCLLLKIQDVTPMRPNWKEWSFLWMVSYQNQEMQFHQFLIDKHYVLLQTHECFVSASSPISC